MEHAFDVLAKQIAGSISRRQAFGVLVRGGMGVLLSSVGLRPAWGQRAIPVPINNPPAGGFCTSCAQPETGGPACCGTCREYNTQTGEVSNCSDPCLAQNLCLEAQKDSEFQLLLSDLTDFRGYQFATYEAVVPIVDGSPQGTALLVKFTTQNPAGQTAAITFGTTAQGTVLVSSAEFNNGLPQYGYTASEGQISQVLPYQLGVSQPPGAQPFAPGPPHGQINPPMSRRGDPIVAPDSLLGFSETLCTTSCGYLCGLGEIEECEEFGLAVCLPLDLTLIGGALCEAAATYICTQLVRGAPCGVLCTQLCGCLTGQEPCGATFCSGTCPAGYECVGGVCILTCPTGESPCGRKCISVTVDRCCTGPNFGQYGVDSDYTCCYNGSCPPGSVCCQKGSARLGEVLCCGDGGTCCCYGCGTDSYSCCPPGTEGGCADPCP